MASLFSKEGFTGKVEVYRLNAEDQANSRTDPPTNPVKTLIHLNLHLFKVSVHVFKTLVHLQRQLLKSFSI